ncbi:amino acid transporter AVT1I [Beta vulgaris subsp. vulgaris]|uniref:amino acid transporter AVT1I n=1 Tax=Beta vulgaris subsp. vulgaris TaxID=3555 RepID=UPI002036BEB8|nr:amino acid transporter AVT1I [Beta vulgaris subsp. vulgaris]
MEGEHNGKSGFTLPVPVPAPAVEELEANNNQLSLIEGNTSLFKTFFNGANTILGNGVILVPYALASGGWLSLILLFTISILATYTGLLVKRCMEVDPKIKSYSDIGEHAFGKIGKIIVSIVLYADLYMATTGFLILEGDNLHNLFPKVAIHAFGISIDGKSSFIIIIALILLPTVLLDNLSIFAYISATGCLAALLVLASIVWVGAFDGVGFHQAQSATLLNWKGLPTSISLYMLCYTSHPVFPTLYTSMQKKHNFFKALLLSFAFSTFIYASMAILGYLMFGSTVESQITLNLPSHKVSSKIAIYTTVITPLVKYALLLKPVVITTEGWFSGKYIKNMFVRVVIRVILVATQVIVALALPFFGYLMALAGALLGATSSLTIPCLCYLKISSTKVNQRLVERVLIWGIVCSSVLILVSGTYTSLVHIVEEIMHK